MSLPSTAFFFGSGISFGSYRPFGPDVGTVGNITRRVLSEQWQETGGIFVPAAPGVDPMFLESGRRAQGLLHYIKGELDCHLRLREGRDSRYEDLYAACLQIFQDESGEITNPLIERSIRAIRSAAAPLYVDLPPSGWGDQFLGLVDSARRLIQSVVWLELGQVRDPINPSGSIDDRQADDCRERYAVFLFLHHQLKSVAIDIKPMLKTATEVRLRNVSIASLSTGSIPARASNLNMLNIVKSMRSCVTEVSRFHRQGDKGLANPS